MSADLLGTVSAMLRCHSMLHPDHRYSRAAAWEMDLATVGLIGKAMNPKFDAETACLDEIQCLGLRVEVVERPGVRLVLTVAER
jgi:hypothetical protein